MPPPGFLRKINKMSCPGSKKRDAPNLCTGPFPKLLTLNFTRFKKNIKQETI